MRSSFKLENDTPDSSKEERFIKLLQRAGEQKFISEDWLVELQNAVVRDVYAQEARYRTKQNWLEDASGRITYFPPPVDDLRVLMKGWEAFVNDQQKQIDPLVKTVCAAFGFVYLHPFFDGNGRLHRFVIHQLLARSGLIPQDIVIPISAVIMKKIPDYLAVLTGFSKPTSALWKYVRTKADPYIKASPGINPYRY
ncbi:Fic family protein [Methylocaldum sp. BRCS4]|uniref:Fic family protein n=1 Tax=Methylocaldum sp. GT1BB TaxID=3438963 RepID=UPI000A320ED0|nr:Fic family protein [Methylocaldum sp. BRCS4]